jgi:predicted nucleic acid-binding protein
MNIDPQMAYFVDTNILVYAYDHSAGQKHLMAAQLMETFWEYENGSISLQVLQEFFVIVTRKIVSPLEFQTARQIVEDLVEWHLHVPGPDDLLQAIDLHHNHQLAFWDAQVIQSAASLGCKQLLSEDLIHGQHYGPVQVIDPFKEMD